MPTTRKRRARAWSTGLDDYRTEDLLGGPGTSLLAFGYGDIARKPLHEWTDEDHAAVREAMRADWARHGSELLAWWIGESDSRSVRTSKWVEPGGPGTRPWAWWKFDAPEPREPDESDAAYLDRLKLWRPGERQRAKEMAKG